MVPAYLATTAPLAATTTILVALGVLERLRHRRALHALPVRVHVNGTRGKSSTTRLVAAGLRAAGLRTLGKTTGSLPRILLPDGHELDVVRTGRANVIEQRDVVALAAKLQVQALVLECMALRPRLQWLCEKQLVAASHAVITNVRPDHLEVMGPNEVGVARALCGMVPVGGKLFTSETKHLDILAHAARDRGTQLFVTGEVRLLPQGARRSEVMPPTDAEMAQFAYREHAANVGVALALLHDLGVSRDVALRGMWSATPDIGALASFTVDFFGRKLVFVNGFAANDPVSTELIWRTMLARYCAEAGAEAAADADAFGDDANLRGRALGVVNCRADRPERSAELGRAAASWPKPHRLLLMGGATHVFARAWLAAGGAREALVVVGDVAAAEVFEQLLAHVGPSALIVGMGNIGGEGLSLVRYFYHRRQLAGA